jgi:hypothetical protein
VSVGPRLRRGFDACNRQSFKLGAEGSTLGCVWYGCPRCRIIDAVSAQAPWRYEIYDDSDPRKIGIYVSGYARSKSSALRAVRRELERRTTRSGAGEALLQEIEVLVVGVGNS